MNKLSKKLLPLMLMLTMTVLLAGSALCVYGDEQLLTEDAEFGCITYKIASDWEVPLEEDDYLVYTPYSESGHVGVMYTPLGDTSILDEGYNVLAGMVESVMDAGYTIDVNEQTTLADGTPAYRFEATGTISTLGYAYKVLAFDGDGGCYMIILDYFTDFEAGTLETIFKDISDTVVLSGDAQSDDASLQTASLKSISYKIPADIGIVEGEDSVLYYANAQEGVITMQFVPMASSALSEELKSMIREVLDASMIEISSVDADEDVVIGDNIPAFRYDLSGVGSDGNNSTMKNVTIDVPNGMLQFSLMLTSDIPTETIESEFEELLSTIRIDETKSFNIPVDVSNKDVIKLVQQALNDAGFDCGEPDGEAGPNTQSAISGYKESKGLGSDSQIDDALIESLGIKEEAQNITISSLQ